MKLKYKVLAPKIATFQKLLEQFGASNTAHPRERTLLELARVSRSELAYSNLLKFFFTPNEEHRLGDSEVPFCHRHGELKKAISQKQNDRSRD
jgi:hypothetical protein